MTPRPVLACLALVCAACGGGDVGGTSTARVPARGGEVWEIAAAPDRADTPAALLAYVHGLHVLVLDGNRVYAGMSRLNATRGEDGSRVLALANGLEASLVPVGEGMELRFSTGETVPLTRREDPR